MSAALPYSKMFFYDDDSESPQRCRDRRRRRIEMRRSLATSVTPPSSTTTTTDHPLPRSFSLSSSVEDADTDEDSPPPLSDVSTEDDGQLMPMLVGNWEVPDFGMMSLAGRRREMEDTVCVRINLCRPEICRRLPVHYFAAFDGHGGSHVAAMCRDRLHEILEEELARVKATHGIPKLRQPRHQTTAPPPPPLDGGGVTEEDEVAEWWAVILKKTFQRMDDYTTFRDNNIQQQNQSVVAVGVKEDVLGMVGSTAIVAILTPDHIVVANCGDSRAVLSRRQKAVPLSLDHKPDRPDEFARIQAAGGRVIYVRGARVQGILAMSRSIGDEYLKPFVIAEPEIVITKRESRDECLILATDGLWDVISSELACNIARTCLREGKPDRDLTAFQSKLDDDDDDDDETDDQDVISPCYPTQGALAAALLTRLALGRGSADNISTIVVNLKGR